VNYYAFIAFFVVALFMLYLRFEWLGLIFFILAVIVLFYDPLKDKSKDAWEEMKKAEGSSPENKFGDYVKTTTKIFAQEINASKKSTINTKDYPKKLHSSSKNFFSELKDLFK